MYRFFLLCVTSSILIHIAKSKIIKRMPKETMRAVKVIVSITGTVETARV